MAPIGFDQVPANSRVPFTAVEIAGSASVQAPQQLQYEVLLIGQLLSTGTADPLTVYQLSSDAQAAELFGPGSQLHRMALRAFQQARDVPVRAIAQADPAGAQATGSLVFAGTATAAGAVYVYVNGTRMGVAVAVGDTAATVATAVAAAITADTNLPVTAAAATGTATLTAKHAGIIGNDLDLRLNLAQGEQLPAGITATTNAFSGGTLSPDYGTLWGVLEPFSPNIWALGDTSAANLTALDIELEDRFGPLSAGSAMAFGGLRGTQASLTTLGDGLNSKHLSLMGANASPSHPSEWAAAVAMVVASSAQRDPARPFQTLQLTGLVPPLEADRFSFVERDLLLKDGISTFNVDDGGRVRIERMITTFQTNVAGAPDTSFLDVNTNLTLSYLRFDLRTRSQLRFPRHKLRSDGGNIPAGQPIVTPTIYKAFVLDIFLQWQALGYVEGFEQFIEGVVVEINPSDPNRLDVLISPDLVNQLRQTAVQIAFLL